MLTIAKQDLSAALDRCESATDEKSPHPFLGMVLLDPQEQQLRMCATNLMVSMDTTAPAQVTKPRGVAVNFRRLRAAVTAMPDGPLKLTLEKGLRLKVACDRQRQYTMAGVEPSNFPKTQLPTGDAVHLPPSNEWLRLFGRVRHAMSHSKDRPFLEGIHLEAFQKQLVAVATSGPLLAIAQVPSDYDGELQQVLFPAMGLKAAQLLLEKCDAPKLCYEPNTLFLETPNALLCVSLPGGDFPPWRKILEHVPRTPLCRVSAPVMLDALRAVSSAREDSTVPVRLRLSDQAIEITVNHNDCDARDVVPVECIGGPQDWECVVDPVYVIDTIKGADQNFILEQAQDQLGISTDDGFLAFIARVTREV